MICVVRQRTPGYYTISVAEGRGLFESIRGCSDLPEMAFAEPSEVSFPAEPANAGGLRFSCS